MARPRIEDEFTEFFEWARGTHRFSPGVAKAYASSLRKICSEINDITNQTAVTAYFEQAAATEDSYARLRAAWSAYAEYLLLTADTQLPQPLSGQSLKAKARVQGAIDKRIPSLPDDVRDALRVLNANGVGMNVVITLIWASVAIKEIHTFPVTHIKMPGKSHQTIIPSVAMQALWNYAQVQNNLHIPLVPLRPGALEIYPLSALRREMGIINPEALTNYNPNDNSALGIVALRKAGIHPSNLPASPEPTGTTSDLLRLLDAPGPPPSTKYVPWAERIAQMEKAEASSRVSQAPPVRASFGDYDEEDVEEGQPTHGGLSSVLGYDPNAKD